MMTRFEINLATPADDGQLRALLAATPMNGSISLAFAREPSYFAASEVDGAETQVGVVRQRDSGRIVGMGSRAISLRHVDGERIAVGYLSGLRLLQEFRGRAGLLARGYRFLRELHTDGRAAYYLTTIADDNHAAVNLLSSGRACLPVYHPCGRFRTVALSGVGSRTGGKSSDRSLHIRQACVEDRDAILRFLNCHGRSRQFFPVYEQGDLFSGAGLLKGLNPEDVLLAIRNGEIVGTLAGWDQRQFKQTIVHGYHGWLRSMRPLYNAWAVMQRRATLPTPGAVVDARLAAIPVVCDDDRNVFRQLLDCALRRLPAQGNPMLLVGMHESDPLLTVVRRYAGREYVTRLYLVYWPDCAPDVNRLVQRAPYLELGCL